MSILIKLNPYTIKAHHYNSRPGFSMKQKTPARHPGRRYHPAF